MSKFYPLLIVLLFGLGIAACDVYDTGEGYYHSSNEEYMENLKKELDAEGFEYSFDNEGYIRFAPEDEARFYEIEDNVEGGSSFVIYGRRHDAPEKSDELDKLIEFPKGYKSENQKLMKVLKQELDSSGVENFLDKDGFVRYRPEDEKRFKDLEALAYAMVSTDHSWGTKTGEIDQDYLVALKKELGSAGVGYSIDDSGVVRFQDGDKEVFKSKLMKIHKMYHMGDGTSASDVQRRERIVYLLKGEGVDYIVFTRNDEVWVKWYVENKARKREIWDKVRGLDLDCRGKMKESGAVQRNSQQADFSGKDSASSGGGCRSFPPKPGHSKG